MSTTAIHNTLTAYHAFPLTHITHSHHTDITHTCEQIDEDSDEEEELKARGALSLATRYRTAFSSCCVCLVFAC